MYNYLEEELEQAALEWFEEIGYEIAYGPEISPEGEYAEREDYSDVILEERLRDALYRINSDIPSVGIEEAIIKIKIPQNPGLIINNQEFQRMITDGVDISYQNGIEIKYDKVWIFDFEDPLLL
jgi:type I restriction enzyme, R subunit